MGATLIRGVAVAGLALAGPLAHAQVEVISPRPDEVSVTIYRDLFALITETRTVDLPEGPVTLSFEGVVETLLPASTVVAETGRELEERNYDYDALNPNSLFEKSIGQEVTLTRTLPGAGKVVQARATIVAANYGGITLHTADGLEALHCAGLPEQVTFAKIPDGLHARPKLSVRLAAGPAGKRTVRLSYLAQGFSWKSDYVARLDATGQRIDLRGWVTLRNLTDASFRSARVQVVAGNLNLLSDAERGTSLFGATANLDEQSRRSMRTDTLDMLEGIESSRMSMTLFGGCHAVPLPEERMFRRSVSQPVYAESIEMQQVMVTGARKSAMAVREELADYQLYSLPWPTDLNARQTKQAVFIDKKNVKVERFYRQFINAVEDDASDMESTAQLVLGIDNRKSAGLGEPLPEGVLRLFESGTDGDLFSGEGSFSDTAVGTPLEVLLANSLDLSLDYEIGEEDEHDREGTTIAGVAVVKVNIANAKGLPVTVEIRQTMNEYMQGVTVTRASQRTLRKFGDYAWRVRVPANSVGTLSYRLRVPEPDEDADD